MIFNEDYVNEALDVYQVDELVYGEVLNDFIECVINQTHIENVSNDILIEDPDPSICDEYAPQIRDHLVEFRGTYFFVGLALSYLDTHQELWENFSSEEFALAMWMASVGCDPDKILFSECVVPAAEKARWEFRVEVHPKYGFTTESASSFDF